MSAEPKKRSRSLIFCWAVLALLAMYPLSIGPVVWITTAYGLPYAWIYRAYRPVYWLAFQTEISRTMLLDYVNLYSTLRWGRHPPSPF
jgi:hypothetical protein